MTPMRASIVGPPLLSATRIKTSTADCPLLDLLFGLRQLLDIFAGVVKGN
jgi:hypothetical protein